MNRQLRRAQEKQEKKLDKEKEERRAERRKRLDQMRAERRRKAEAAVAKRRGATSTGTKDAKPAAAASSAPAKPSPNDPGRFSGAFAIATVFFIILQGVVPTESETAYGSYVEAGFYLMLGYFLTLWLLRRQHAQALVLTAVAGVILLTGTWLGSLLRPEAVLDPVVMLLALPLLAVGAWLARLVYNMAQRQSAA